MLGLSLGLTIGAQGGGGVVLPPGGIGLWDFTKPVATPTRHVRNELISTAPSSNLLRASRRQFNDPTFWYKSSGITITDANAVSWDGANGASTIACSAGTYIVGGPASANLSLPGGAYTVGVNVRWTGVGSPDFKLTVSNGVYKNCTATSEWQRFSFTETRPANAVFPQWSTQDGGTFEISDFELYAGSSDLGPQAITPHCYVGATEAAATPVTSGACLDMTSGGASMISLAAPVALNAFTLIAVYEKAATVSSDEYQPFLSYKNNSWGSFSIGTWIGQNPAHISGVSIGPSVRQLGQSIWDSTGAGIRVVAYRFDGRNFAQWLGGNKILTGTQTLVAPFSIADFTVGTLQKIYKSGHKVYSLALWPSALSDDDVLRGVSYMQNIASKSSLTLATKRLVAFAGDSIAYGANLANNVNYANVAATLASIKFVGANFGVSGSTLSNNISNTTIAALRDTTHGLTNYACHIHLGTNDLAFGATASTALANLDTWIDVVRSAGYKIIVDTVIDRSGGFEGGATAASFNAERTTFNAGVRSRIGTNIDAVCDFGDDALPVEAAAAVGAYGASTNAAYFQTASPAGVHPTAAGAAIMAPIIAAAIDGVW